MPKYTACEREEAALICERLASQATWRFGARTIPGPVERSRSRGLALDAISSEPVRRIPVDDWRRGYALAARLIRDGEI